MKNLYRLICASTALLTTAKAAPFLAVGDGAELFATGTVGVRADDNIFSSTNAGLAAGAPSQVLSDTIFEFTPGLDFTFGKHSDLKGNLTLEDQFLVYADNNGLNSQLFSADLHSEYDDSKMKLGLDLGFHELNQNSIDIRGLTRRDQSVAKAKSEVVLTEKTAVGVDFSYDRSNYRRVTYSDSEVTTIPLSAYYKITPKVDLSAGFRFRDTQEQIGADSQDHYYNLGARGQFTPKLSGKFTVGYNERSRSTGQSDDGVGVDASFDYKYTEKTTLTLGGSKDFGTSAQGKEQKNTSVNFNADSKLSDQWSVGLNGAFRAAKYVARREDFTSDQAYQDASRTDKYYEIGANGTYIYNAYVTFKGGYTYKTNKSPLASGEFTNNVFSLSAILRY